MNLADIPACPKCIAPSPPGYAKRPPEALTALNHASYCAACNALLEAHVIFTRNAALEEAAGIICDRCDNGSPVTVDKDGEEYHTDPADQFRHYCEAQPIRDLKER